MKRKWPLKRVVALVLVSPLILVGIVVALPFVMFGGLVYGFNALLDLVADGEVQP